MEPGGIKMKDNLSLFLGDAEPNLPSAQEYVEDVSPGSDTEAHILEILRKSYLDCRHTSKWKPAKIQLVTNKALDSDYEEKKQDFMIRGRKNEELTERFGFYVENNVALLELLSSVGPQTRDSEYNALGYNRMGVYLSKHSDVCLQHALVKHSGSQVMRLVICKYIPGKHTTAIPRVASAAEFIEPTQGFDCHMSVIPPNPRDSLQNQFDRSQVYVYEINKLLQPGSRPRQILPYAIVTYTEGGAYHSLVDAQATTAEKLAVNPRLQQIINAINAKADNKTTPANGDKKPKSLGPPPPPPPPIGGASSSIPSSSHLTSMPSSRVTAPSTHVSHVNHRMLSNNPPAPPAPGNPGMLLLPNGGSVSHIPQHPNLLPRGDNNLHLRRIIDQLNAKLEADETGKKSDVSPPVPSAHPAAPTSTLPVNGAGPSVPRSYQTVQTAPSRLNTVAPSTGVLPHQLYGQNGMLAGPAAAYATIPAKPITMDNFAAGSGLLGTIPPSNMIGSFSRSSPLGSLSASRPLTPDVPVSAAIMNGAALSPGLMSASPGVYMSTAPTGYGSLAGYLGGAAGLIGTPMAAPAMGVYGGKELLQYDYGTGLLNQTAMMAAPSLQSPGLFAYQAPTGAALTPTYLLNQPVKRYLSDGYVSDEKRFKYN